MIIYRLLIFACFLLATNSQANTAAPTKSSQPTMKASKVSNRPSFFQGEVELRHQMNSFYDDEGYLLRQEPSLQLGAKVGFSAYQGLADVYAKLGVVKMTESLRVIQKRPEIAIDIYPLVTENLLVNQYHLLSLPFSESSYDTRNKYVERQGAIYRPGVATTAFLKMQNAFFALRIKAGLDLWTEVYSRDQYFREVEEVNGHFALVRDAVNQQPIARKSPSIFSESMLNIGIAFPWLTNFSSDVGVHYDNFFHESALGDEPRVERESFLKWALVYTLKKDLVLSNDLIRYHYGFLGPRMTTTKRGFRNIFRITQAL